MAEPREGVAEVAALVLAAGQASRYREAGGREATKLAAAYRGEPLVCWAVRAALASRARPVLVVTGHAREEVETALAGFPVRFVHNTEYADGLSTSLRAGIAALPSHAVAAVVLLGDMPDATAGVVNALIAAFSGATEAAAAVALYNGRRGNPVLLGRQLFGEVAGLNGDEGARALLLALAPDKIAAVEVNESGVTRDVDRPGDLASTVVVREAQARDRTDIVGAIAELQDFERRLSETRLAGAAVADAYYERLDTRAREQGAFLIAEVQGAFAGFVVGWIEQADEISETPDSNRFGYVSDICVKDNFRRMGVGQSLLHALEARLIAFGVTRLRLNFLAANMAAGAAYTKAGYAPYEITFEKRIA